MLAALDHDRIAPAYEWVAIGSVSIRRVRPTLGSSGLASPDRIIPTHTQDQRGRLALIAISGGAFFVVAIFLLLTSQRAEAQLTTPTGPAPTPAPVVEAAPVLAAPAPAPVLAAPVVDPVTPVVDPVTPIVTPVVDAVTPIVTPVVDP